ncbi:MAG: hypothetical protein Tsb0021_05740 [Chlamydiales bacterium]
MLKEASYQDKFCLLVPFTSTIILDIKKDLKALHLKNDPIFAKKHFPGKLISRITNEEILKVYTSLIESTKDEEMLEWISNRWLLLHTDIYYAFEQEISVIYPNFSEISSLQDDLARSLVAKGIQSFGSLKTYIFSVLNSVVYSEQIFQDLRKEALISLNTNEKIISETQSQDLETLHHDHQKELAKCKDHYEKRINGLLKKYERDTLALKKQITLLHRKLSEKGKS